MYTILAMTVPNGPLLGVIFVLRLRVRIISPADDYPRLQVLAKIREKSAQMSMRTNKLHRSFTKVYNYDD